MTNNSLFILACQSGGGEKSEKFEPIFYYYKKMIEENFKDKYSDEIDELSFIFRVDGKFVSWNIKGCHLLELKIKKKYITIDIGITDEVLDLDDKKIHAFVQTELYRGAIMMMKNLNEKKINFKSDILLEQFKNLLLEL